MKETKYCALTTVAASLNSFVIPAMDYLSEHGYAITLSCAQDIEFMENLEKKYTYYPLDIERGFKLKKTIYTIIDLYHFFKRESFDMIEYGTENVAFCASIAGFLARVPVRIYNHWGARYVGLNGLSRSLSIWIERLSALFSTDIRQVSYRNADMCVRRRIYSKKKVKVLGKGGTIGVDLNKFDSSLKKQYRNEIILQYKLPEASFLYGFVGRIQKDKGINELIQAFKKLVEEYDAYLMLVGSIDDQNPIDKENMEWAQNSERVIFTGVVTDVYRYMSAFDILVHPTYREGFGMVLQEAAAVKTPIITTDIMGPGEFIQNGTTGILVQPRNKDTLYNAIEQLYRNDSELRRYAENNYQYVKDYFERSVMIRRIFEDRELLRKRMG